MEFYSRVISPFCARVRVSLLAKGLRVRLIESPDVASDAFAKLNPYKRVPVLVLEDRTPLLESEVIVEYLEDCFPEVSLRPEDLRQRARARLIARAAELYLFPCVVDLFRASDAQQLAALRGLLEQNLSRLSSLLDGARPSWHVIGTQLTLGDAALAPFLAYVDMLGVTTGHSWLTAHPALDQFWQGAQRDPVLSAVTGEMAQAMKEARRQGASKRPAT